MKDEQHINWAITEVPKGWHSLFYDMVDALKATGKDFYILQAKEKFGGLRVYLGAYEAFDGPDIFSEIIDSYERAASIICQECGSIGMLREINGWYATLCGDCAEKRTQSTQRDT